jgi:D-alanine transaminase
LLDENDLRGSDALVYIQITRGTARRTHVFPDPPVEPTVFVQAELFRRYPESMAESGVSTITVPDLRWARCDVKSVSLLANVLAQQQAREEGAFEALLVRDGMVVEGTHANLLALIDGALVTYPESNYLLCGVTRNLVLARARDAGIDVREAPIPLAELYRADEVILTGTTSEVMPVVQVDGRSIGDGRPGHTARHLRREYFAEIRKAVAG